jgi:hypothetical protein
MDAVKNYLDDLKWKGFLAMLGAILLLDLLTFLFLTYVVGVGVGD